ncbi:MAG: UDP-2,3-diacylglucosamine diphosphatase [Marinilabiliales bacterium]
MVKGKKIYFISDCHLGFPNHNESLEREKLLVKFLNEIENDAKEIYLLGDIFDFWFEYKRVVPRGFTRFLGKIAEFTDNGIPVHFFTGNHDIWVFDYLPAETGVILHKNKLITEFYGKKFLIAHGDGLGPCDKGFKRMKKVFTNPFAQWCFARIHPNLGVKIASSMSHKSRYKLHPKELQFKGADKEWLILYAKRKLENSHYDYFVFGHRHIPIKYKLTDNSTFINLGDWMQNFTYGVFDGKTFELIRYYPEKRIFKYLNE